MNDKICIAWTDLTLIRSSLKTDTIVLNSVNGLAQFGTITAVMGPSGSGITSLLMALNGNAVDQNLRMASNSIIRFHRGIDIRTTFVSNNEKDYLLMGLTVEQNLLYASRLKNSCLDFEINHSLNVQNVMSELMISNVSDNRAEKCSGGELKRLAIAMELTAYDKPNLILMDEPTTGLDSHIASVMMDALKKLTIKQNLCLIVSLHQPNGEVLSMCDYLYVLSKGGHNCFWGPTQHLRDFMVGFDIDYNTNPVPIETLIELSANGLKNDRIRQMKASVREIVGNWIQSNEDLIPKPLNKRLKKFYSKDIVILLRRELTELWQYKYKWVAMNAIVTIIINLLVIHNYGTDIGKYDDCFGPTDANNTCEETLKRREKVERNVTYIGAAIWIVSSLLITLMAYDKSYKLRILLQERKNNYYGTLACFISETLKDSSLTFLLTLLSAITTYYLTNQPPHLYRFIAYLCVWLICLIGMNWIAELLAIVFYPYIVVSLLLGCLITSLLLALSNFTVLYNDRDLSMKITTNFSMFMPVFNLFVYIFYGMDRCENGRVSSKLKLLEMDQESAVVVAIVTVILHLITFKLFALIILHYKQKTSLETYLLKIIKNCRGESTETFEMHNVSSPPCIEMENINLEQNDAGSAEEGDLVVDAVEHPVNICWKSLTVKIEKTFYREEKIILRSINGYVRFGSLLALMGPSGAGKSSLLKALNGITRKMMTKESKILYNNIRPIKSCFMAQDVRQQTIGGLTVGQSLLYASKLKNHSVEGRTVDHNNIVVTLLNEFAIADIKDLDYTKCSSGQLKRCVLAMELCAEQKPTLICVDEPTSGLDSHSAKMIIECLKLITQRHDLSIIVSIHQPSSDLLDMFDNLYVMSRGGVNVFGGPPHELRQHLRESNIDCDDNQIPIETLLKICANDYDDSCVSLMTAKTKANYESSGVLNSNPNYEDIPQRLGGVKRFTLRQTLTLLQRNTLAFFARNRYQLFVLIIFTTVSGFVMKTYPFEHDKLGQCQNNTETCSDTILSVKRSSNIKYELLYLYAANLSSYNIYLWTAVLFSAEFNAFLIEQQNGWYNVNSYFIVKNIIDSIITIISMTIFAAIVQMDYNSWQTFFEILLVCIISSIIFQQWAHISAILFGNNYAFVAVIVYCYAVLYSGNLTPDKDASSVTKVVSGFNPIKPSFERLVTSLYGLYKCPSGELANVMTANGWDEDTYDLSLYLLISQCCLFLLIEYICFRIKCKYSA